MKESKQSGFWPTVIKVELADIAFAVDSILAAVAIIPSASQCGQTKKTAGERPAVWRKLFTPLQLYSRVCSDLS